MEREREREIDGERERDYKCGLSLNSIVLLSLVERSAHQFTLYGLLPRCTAVGSYYRCGVLVFAVRGEIGFAISTGNLKQNRFQGTTQTALI